MIQTADVYCVRPYFMGLIMNSVAEIEQAIAQAGLSVETVLRTAGMCVRSLSHIKRGRYSLTPRTSRRIELAISELKRLRKEAEAEARTDGRAPSASRVAAQYRIAIGFVAQVAGVAPRFMLDADPKLRATADPAWLKASRLRFVALYIANQYLGVPQAELARAAGMSKSNVSRALGEVENLRDTNLSKGFFTRREGRAADIADDLDMEAILTSVERAFE